jgi:tetratricopeptide (TPR) repeat protein
MIHLTDEQFVLYLFDPERLSDFEAVDSHIKQCGECRERADVETSLEADLQEPHVWDDVAGFQTRRPGLDSFLDEARRIEKEDGEAARRLAPLFKSMIAFEDADIASDRRFHTAGVVRRLCAEAARLHDRKPKWSLPYAAAGAAIARQLDQHSAANLSALAIAIREQAMALRFLGEYREALKLLDEAERHFERLHGGAYDLAVAWYARAAVLVQFDEADQTQKALSLVKRAAEVFLDHADDQRLLRARVLEATCLYHLNRKQESLAAFDGVIALAERLAEKHILAYGFQNAAIALTALSDFEKAERYFAEALALYDELGIAVEEARTEREVARLLVLRGELAKGDEALDAARRKLLSLGLRDDHALATLDWSEVRLALAKPEGVAEACRQIILRYESEGMTRNARLALAHLHEALRTQRATPQLVREVREYLVQLPRRPHVAFLPSRAATPA